MKNLRSAVLAIGCMSVLMMHSFTPLQASFQPTSGADNTSYDYSSDNDVFLASSLYTFEIGCKALILKPSGSLMHYAAEAEPLPLPSPSWKIHDVKTDYHPGFDLEVATIFQNRNANAKLNWEHLHSKDTSRRVVGSNDMIGPFFEIGPDALLYTQSKGKYHVQFDAIKLNGGLFVNLGSYLQANIYAGVNGTRIKQTVTAHYSNSAGNVARTITVPSTFTGMGPQLGVDLSYSLIAGIDLTGNATASLLVGSLKNHTTYKSLSPALKELGISPPNIQGVKVYHRTQVVPAFEGSLGIGYTYTACTYSIHLEAGYQAKIFLNAVQSTDIGSEVLTPPVLPDTIGVFARSFQRNLSNFALAGPYVALNVYF